jgi:hypothetical protein
VRRFNADQLLFTNKSQFLKDEQFRKTIIIMWEQVQRHYINKINNFNPEYRVILGSVGSFTRIST